MTSRRAYFDGHDPAGHFGRDEYEPISLPNMTATPMQISDLLHDLWQRKRVLFLCGVLACAAAIGVMRLYPSRYYAEGLLLVESREFRVPGLDPTPTASTAPDSRDHTVIDVLRSRPVLEGVARSLHMSMDDLSTAPRLPAVLVPIWSSIRLELASVAHELGLVPPRLSSKAADDNKLETIVQYLQKHIAMDMADGSRIVPIRFESTIPTLSASVVNTLMSNYIAGDVARNEDLVRRTTKWLSERVAQLRVDVDQADQRVQSYKRDNSLFRVQAGSLQAVQLGADQNALSLARQELSRKEAAVSTAQNAARGAGSGVGSEEALSSPIIQSLRNRETDLLRRYALVGQHVGPANQDKAAIDEELRTVRQQMDVENKTILSSLNRDAMMARLRVGYLENLVAGSQKLASDSANAETALAGLERDATVKRQTYNEFVMRSDHTQFDPSAFVSARVVSPAVAPTRPESSHIPLIGLLAFIGGTLIGAAYLLVRRRLDGTVRSIVDLAQVTRLPTLGSLPRLSGNVQAAALEEGSSLMAETLRAMRVRLLPRNGSDLGTTVLVTSSDINEGKTTVATALARRLAADGVEVLLIEADFRRPKIAAMLNLASGMSLETILQKGLPIEQGIRIDPETGLHCLVASGQSSSKLPLFDSERFDALMASARRSYQLVILDSPPVMRVADPILLSRWSDITLFVVRCNRTSFALVKEALRRLPDSQRATLLLALNFVTRHQFDQRDYYGGYGTAYKPALPLAAIAAGGSSK